MENKDRQTLELIAQTLYDKKGFNILVLDVHKISTLTNFYVIAEGNVERHVKALAREVVDVLEQQGTHLYHQDATSSDWVVLDFADVIVHIMVPETRDRYALEELWRESSVVDVKISIGDKL